MLASILVTFKYFLVGSSMLVYFTTKSKIWAVGATGGTPRQILSTPDVSALDYDYKQRTLYWADKKQHKVG